ncbi:HAD family hydrolase [Halomonas getboli]|uniref:HAD family hydrolase n=1 Tax=Halomonas getboli TaxID=2935862 RepID=UPI001FFFAE09|nr:HAD-IA family hydrolase [Halomonas getboli]MCK2184483.1 HAD-IA family hydrolase [Halomonas getboli]
METLIFDCDGVLVDSETIAEATLIQRLGAWLPDVEVEAVLAQALGMTTADILAHLEGLSAHRLPVGALGRLDDEIEARLADELRAIDGVAEAIAALDLPLAVVSNSRRQRVLASLETTGLAARLGEVPIFTADQVERPKPDPAVYRHAAARLGRAPEDCLAVEDSVSGVIAAHRAGMTVIGFVGASHVSPGQAGRLSEAGAWHIIAHMDELVAQVRYWREARRPAAGG